MKISTMPVVGVVLILDMCTALTITPEGGYFTSRKETAVKR